MTSFQSLTDRQGTAPAYLRLQESLAEFRAREAGTIALPKDLPSAQAVEKALGSGRCLAQAAKLVPPPDQLHGALTRLVAALGGVCNLPPSFVRWTGSVRSGNGMLLRWFRAVTQGDAAALETVAQSAAQDVELLKWSGRELAKPFFHRFGREISGEQIKKWRRGSCPCCGGPPRVARLERETGARSLWCDLCGLEWPVARLCCPFCGNEDAASLGNLEIEEEKSHRIAVCEKCKGYVLTVDERGLPEGAVPDLEAENAAMLHLQFLAESQGYRLSDPAIRGGRNN